MEKKTVSEARLGSLTRQRPGSRQRAIKTCFSCRRRKVRCDLSHGVRPCTKCTLDGFTCDIEKSSQGRDDGRRHLDGRNPATANAAQQCMAVSVASPAPQSPARVRLQQRAFEPVNISFDQLFESLSQTSGIGDLFTLERPAPAKPKVQIQPSYLDENCFLQQQQQQGFRLQPACPSVSCPLGKDDADATFYPFLKRTRLDRLDQDDVKFLEQRGCLTLPSKAVLDVFMRQHFLYVHPLLPIFDECAFWHLYQQPECVEGSEHQLSLFTFRAMLAAASTKVPIGTLVNNGFASHEQACRILFRRAKHLYDFRTEEDPLAIAQGALMLSLVAPADRMHQDNTLWLNIAIQYTKALLGSRSPGQAYPSPAWAKSAQRLWRCCLIRDRILSLGMRRPLQIIPESYDASMALDWIPEGVEEDKGEYGGSLIHDVDTQRYFAKLHVACVRFAIMLTDLLMMVYPHNNAEVTPIASLSDHSDFVLRVERCRSDLDKWSTTFLTEFPDSPLPTHTSDVAVFFWNFLLMCQSSARIALHQHEITTAYFYPGYINAYDSLRLSAARSNIYDSIQIICDLTRRLQAQDLLSKLPPTAPACVAYPFLILKLSMKLQSTVHTPPLIITMWKTLQESMDVYKAHYTVIEDVFSSSWKLLHMPDQGQGPDTTVINLCPTGSQQHLAVKLQWCDDFRRNAEVCLRASMALDLNIAKGANNGTADRLPFTM